MKRLTTEEFINKANNLHKYKYDYSKVIYKNGRTKIEIICKKHGSFFQKAELHLQKGGCPKCSKNYKLNLLSFIEKANIIHNNKYDYSNVFNFKNSLSTVEIICKNHGPFKQKVKNHLKGWGCKKCSNNNTISVEDFIYKSNKTHNHKYNYELIKLILNSKNKVPIICPNHGLFYQNVYCHMNGQGCFKCNKRILSIEEFKEKCKIIHNNIYNYDHVNFKSQNEKIIIVCKKHGKFLQIANHHLKGAGCKKCVMHSSKIENRWLDTLNIPEENRFVFKRINGTKCIFDGFDEKTNTVYEFYGDFWHGNPKIYNHNDINKAVKKTFGELYNKTIERENLIRNAGYNLVTIWESDFKNV